MPNFSVTLTLAADTPFGYQVIVPGTYIGLLSTTGASVCTIAGGSITAFNVLVATDPEVTDPSPDVLFDFVGAGADVSYDTVSGVLTVGSVAPAEINADTNPDAPVPFQIFLELTSTSMGVEAAARVAPDEGNFATGTWKFTPLGDTAVIDCSISIGEVEPISLGCGPSPLGQVGQPYSAALAASGGVLPYDFSVIAGTLPTGLTMNPGTGVISGIPTSQGTFPFTAQVVSLSDTSSLAQVFPPQLTQNFDLSSNASNNPVFLIGGNIFLFTVDAIGDFTWQIFIYMSADGGVTWTNVTPGAAKFEGFAPPLGLTYYAIGTVIYIPQIYTQGDGSQWARVYRFDTVALDWLADSLDIQVGFTGGGGNDSFVGLQCAVRGSEIVVITTNNANPVNTFQTVLLVYDTVGNNWTTGPTQILGTDVYDICSGGTDSAGHLHFFAGLWPSAARDTSGTFEAQHFVVHADNSVSGPDSIVVVTPYVVPTHDSGNAAWVSVGQPVFYMDGTSRRMAIAIRVDSTTLQVFVAAESDTPAWTAEGTILATGGQVFETSSACFMFTASLMPVVVEGVTRLYVFFVSQEDGWNSAGSSFLAHAYLQGGMLSASTVDYAPGPSQLMPGPLYPILTAQTLGAATIGGFLPVFDGVNFLVDASCLSEFWLSLGVTGSSDTVDCSIAVSPAATLSPQIAGGIPGPRGSNEWDTCLEGIRDCYRSICRRICPKPKPAISWPWDLDSGLPANAVPFARPAAIVTPFTAAGDVVVLQFRVPVGYDGIIMQGYNLYQGSGFVQGSGDILWRIRLNSYYVKDWGSMPFSFGSVRDPFPFADAIFLLSNQLVTMLVNVPNTSGSIQVGASRILGALMGYFLPR